MLAGQKQRIRTGRAGQQGTQRHGKARRCSLRHTKAGTRRGRAHAACHVLWQRRASRLCRLPGRLHRGGACSCTLPGQMQQTHVRCSVAASAAAAACNQ